MCLESFFLYAAGFIQLSGATTDSSEGLFISLSVDHCHCGYNHSGSDRLHLIKLEEITYDLCFHLIGSSFVLIYFMSALTQMFTLGDPSYLPPRCSPAGSP